MLTMAVGYLLAKTKCPYVQSIHVSDHHTISAKLWHISITKSKSDTFFTI